VDPTVRVPPYFGFPAGWVLDGDDDDPHAASAPPLSANAPAVPAYLRKSRRPTSRQASPGRLGSPRIVRHRPQAQKSLLIALSVVLVEPRGVGGGRQTAHYRVLEDTGSATSVVTLTAGDWSEGDRCLQTKLRRISPTFTAEACLTTTVTD
jgi:hypothetical protein